jgi:hypothetical protein
MNYVNDLWMVIAIELWFDVVFLDVWEPLGHIAHAPMRRRDSGCLRPWH